MATIEELTARIETLEAMEDIRRTMRDYAFFHDQGRHREMLEVFEPDCTVEVTGFGPSLEKTVVGHDAIFEFYGGERDQDEEGALNFKHNITGEKIDVDGEDATVMSYLLVTSDIGKPMQDGLYQDKLRRGEDGRWRFYYKRIAGIHDRSLYHAINHNF